MTTSRPRERFVQALGELPGKYDELGQAINEQLNVDPQNVYLTEYPDPTTDANGNWARFPEILAGINAKEAKWASQTVLGGLNTAARETAARWGWTFVGGISSSSAGPATATGSPPPTSTGSSRRPTR